jgi:hypothetical protein
MTNKAGAITHAGLQLIAVSLHRLFLGGLLPSRARFRFAGSAPIRLQTQLPQSRDSQLLHTSIVSPTGCTPHGLLTNDQLNGWIGSICFLGGIAWSAWDKWQREGRL